ncbi:MAG: imidazoleglycerol-phosphate dehydratase HisB [Clostridia bacterium]|nr:imidazoleglycerol-phosphate dehydratase HisB [Clostridia bacterium]
MRTSEIYRKTNETEISLKLELDGSGKSEIKSGCPFLDHMLTLFAAHGGFDLSLVCRGDVEVDYHHTVEDIGIALGDAVYQSLGDKRGINRYGYMVLPMDETLIVTAIDISGRALLNYDLRIPTPRVGDFDTELVEEFFLGFVRHANLTLHVKQLDGKNSHHVIEGAFKAFARALSVAVSLDPSRLDVLPSTKGLL